MARGSLAGATGRPRVAGSSVPVRVQKGTGSRPWKIVERGGKVVATSTSKAKADASARARNAAYSKTRGRGVT